MATIRTSITGARRGCGRRRSGSRGRAESAMTGLRSSSSDLRHFLGQARDAQEQFAQRVDVGRRMAAISLQQSEAPDSVQQLVGVAIGQRRDPEMDVLENLDVNPAQAEARPADRTADRR